VEGPKAVDQINQSQQIGRGEWAPTLSDHHERIDRRQISPTCWQREQLPVLVVQVNPILAPVVAVHHKLEFPPEQRMEPMSHPHTTMPIVEIRCS
jgi:hypothetical protein